MYQDNIVSLARATTKLKCAFAVTAITAQAEFVFARVDLINGDTLIKKRQEIVNRFQMYRDAPGFDLLVLKADYDSLVSDEAFHDAD